MLGANTSFRFCAGSDALLRCAAVTSARAAATLAATSESPAAESAAAGAGALVSCKCKHACRALRC